jgi:HK97 family phage portal protein
VIVRTRGADVELRYAGQFGPGVIVPPRGSGIVTTGVPVTTSTMAGLPAAMQAIRQPSVLIASLELAVCSGRAGDKERQDDSWQAKLFEQPDGGTGDFSAFDWLSDLNSSLEGFGNAFARKIRGRGRFRGQLVALEPIHPDLVWVRRENGEKTFRVRIDNKTVDLTSADVLHIRDFIVGGDIAAPTPVQVHRESLGIALALQEFQGRFFANDAKPGAVMSFPYEVREDQAKQWVKLWNDQHQGPSNAGKIGVIGGGAEITTLPISLGDAQFIESQQFSVEQIARIFNWPAWALDHDPTAMIQRTTAELGGRNLLAFYLRPRLKRLAGALKKDPDLFGGSDFYPEFQTQDFISIDAVVQANVDHMNIQSGLRLVDEIRAERGYPDLPNGAGKIPQITPVGGAPNPTPMPSPPDPKDPNYDG